MQKHWLHPLNLLVVIVAFVSLGVWSIETFLNIGNGLAKFSNDRGLSGGWSWAHVISGTIWVVGFSAGVVGFLVNISQAIRLRAPKVKDFSVMNELDKDEVKELNLWLDSNTYESSHLKELWSEENQ